MARLADGTVVRDPAAGGCPARPLRVTVARGTLSTRVEGEAQRPEELLP